MSIGISIGAAIGVATNNFPLYMLVGFAIGVGIDLLDGQNRNRESDESQKDDEEE